jgi:hypothetical protein
MFWGNNSTCTFQHGYIAPDGCEVCRPELYILDVDFPRKDTTNISFVALQS